MEGPPIAREILSELGMEAGKIDSVCGIIANHHSAADANTVGTLEFQTVWDADWMVNFPRTHRDKAKDRLRGIVSETFKTSHGQYLAGRSFLE
jgi:hypothetical protein